MSYHMLCFLGGVPCRNPPILAGAVETIVFIGSNAKPLPNSSDAQYVVANDVTNS